VSADELDARVRSLHAERARPNPEPPSAVEDLLRRLIATVHAAFTTLPDGETDLTTRAGRVAEFGRLRHVGFNVYQAARQVGVSTETGRRYEAELRRESDW